MGEVTLPDGTVVKNVPEGTSREEVIRGIQMWRNLQNPFEGAGQAQKHPDWQAFGQGAATRVANAVANAPDLAANIAASGYNAIDQSARQLRAAPQLLNAMRTGQVNNPEALVAAAEPGPFSPPALGQDYVPGPDGYDLLGAVQRGGETAAAVTTGDFSQFSQDPAADQRQLTQQLMSEHPTEFFMGQLSGDILNLITLRAPISRARGQQELRSADILGEAAKGKPLELAPNVGEAVRSITVRSPAARTLLNRAGRSAETGFEGLALAALNGEADPVETFGVAAGVQAGGSMLLSATSGLLKGGVKNVGINIGMASLGVGALVQSLKSAAPGGRDFILESMETGFSKVVAGLLAGVVSGAAGMGRVTRNFPVTLAPRMADTLTALPRAGTLSLITQAMDDPAILSVVEKLAKDPNYFGPTASNRLARAYKNGNFRDEFESLMAVESFREKFEAIK